MDNNKTKYIQFTEEHYNCRTYTELMFLFEEMIHFSNFVKSKKIDFQKTVESAKSVSKEDSDYFKGIVAGLGVSEKQIDEKIEYLQKKINKKRKIFCND